MAFGLGLGPIIAAGGGGGGGGGADVLTYGATVTPDADEGGFKTLACVNGTSATWTLEKATGDGANFIIQCTNSDGTIGLTLGSNVTLRTGEPSDAVWNNREGAINLISCQWDGTTMRVSISPGVAGTPTVLAGANAVSLNGTNTWLEDNGGLTGAANGKLGIISAWLRPRNVTADQYIIRGALQAGAAQKVSFTLQGGGTILVQGTLEGSGTFTLAMITTAKIKVNEWTHILASWDLGNARGEVYFNDVDVTPGGPTLNDNDIDYTHDSWTIGALEDALSNGNKYNGDIAELYFNMEATLDLDTASNRRKFIDVNRQPVALGANGETPTGATPLVFFSGATATWHTNKGDGGGFTENGALTDVSQSP